MITAAAFGLGLVVGYLAACLACACGGEDDGIKELVRKNAKLN